MSLFTFHNEFDDVDVVLDDEAISIRECGPFSVSLVFNAPEIGTADDNQRKVFPTLSEAKAAFLKLVENEIDAVLAETTDEPIAP